MIYFDSAATSLQKPPQVKRAVQWALNHCASVGRGGHFAALRAAETVFDCRLLASELFDAKPEQVVFTANATHGLNIAIGSLVPEGGRVLISGFEHNAVTRPLHAGKARVTVAGKKLFDQADTLEAFQRALKEDFDAVICTQVSNVFGYILPVYEIARMCAERQIPLIIDASQGAGVLPVSLKKSGAAFIAMPGHKGLYGPQGTGILLCGRGGEPLLFGGTGGSSELQNMPDFLPDRLEAGTHNVCGIAGLREGLRFVKEKSPEALLKKEQSLLHRLLRELRGEEALECFHGADQAGVISLRPREKSCEETAELFSARGIALRAGLHCAPLAHESAGTKDTGTLRLSFSAFNTEDEIRQFLKISKIIFDKKGKSRLPSCY